MLSSELPFNLLLEVEYEDNFWEWYSPEGVSQIFVQGFWVVIFPDSVSFFNDAEKMIIDKKTENEMNTSLQYITAHLSQDSSPAFLFVGCFFSCAAFQYSHEMIHHNWKLLLETPLPKIEFNIHSPWKHKQNDAKGIGAVYWNSGMSWRSAVWSW